MQHVLDASDVVVLEGTGHTAVGSVVDLNNAQVLLLIIYSNECLVPAAVHHCCIFHVTAVCLLYGSTSRATTDCKKACLLQDGRAVDILL